MTCLVLGGTIIQPLSCRYSLADRSKSILCSSFRNQAFGVWCDLCIELTHCDRVVQSAPGMIAYATLLPLLHPYCHSSAISRRDFYECWNAGKLSEMHVDHRHCPRLVVCNCECLLHEDKRLDKRKQFLFKMKYYYFSICPFIYIFIWTHFYIASDRNTFLHQPILILVLYGVSGSTKGAWPSSENALTIVTIVLHNWSAERIMNTHEQTMLNKARVSEKGFLGKLHRVVEVVLD